MPRPFPHRWRAYSIGPCRHYAQHTTPTGEISVQQIGTRGEPLTAQQVRTAAAAAPVNGVIVTTDPQYYLFPICFFVLLMIYWGMTTWISTFLVKMHGLNLKTIAEGVEDAALAEQLRRMGCDEVQGYLYGRPQPPEDIERLIGFGLEVDSSLTLYAR